MEIQVPVPIPIRAVESEECDLSRSVRVDNTATTSMGFPNPNLEESEDLERI
jgi:hypothetical protein